MFLKRTLLPLLLCCGLTGCIFQTETEPSSGWDLEANNTSNNTAANNTTQGGNNTSANNTAANNTSTNNTSTNNTSANNTSDLPEQCREIDISEDGECAWECEEYDPDCSTLPPCQSGPLTCMNPPPDCPLDTVPEIVDGCYGDCVDGTRWV